ncbi:MAG: NnrU family protein [Hahellaceae bacterium]|nr:NnrU family protein [Hahellaceae bacterium]MCP5209853.1 NnrU family protein [Hahellaceae bacterium]
MEMLIAGLAVFFAAHLVPAVPPLRNALVRLIGLMPYKGVFSLVSIVGLVLIALGAGRAPFEILWFPDIWWVEGAKMLMLPAFILVVSAYIPSDIGKSVKQPMLLGVGLWAIAHLIANGDLATTILFASFLGYAIVGSISATLRGIENSPKRTSFELNMAVLVVAGIGYALVGFFHEELFGVKIY